MTTTKLACSLLAGGLTCVLASTYPAAAQERPATTTSQTQQRPTAQQGVADSRSPVKDSWITMKIHSQFIPEDALEDSDIDVETNNGVVTLTGTVPTAAGQARAVAIAKATDGVKSVNDKLRVGPADDDDADATAAGREAARETKGAAKSGAKKVTDGWIKSKIYTQYMTEDALEDSDVNIDVQRGVVTLKGTVASAAGKTRAEAIAKATDGVRSVTNQLTVGRER